MSADIKDFDSLLASISDKLKQAMIAKQELELETLRMLKAAIKNYQIELGSTTQELTLVQAFDLLRKEVKRREQVAEEYRNAGRTDLSEKEIKEAKIIAEFLPEEIGDNQLRELVRNAKNELNISSINQVKNVFEYIENVSDKSFSRSKVSKFLGEELNQ